MVRALSEKPAIYLAIYLVITTGVSLVFQVVGNYQVPEHTWLDFHPAVILGNILAIAVMFKYWWDNDRK